MEYQRRFFKDKQRAREFCKQVNGELHYRNSFCYEVELEHIEYPEGLKEEFEYLVVWKNF